MKSVIVNEMITTDITIDEDGDVVAEFSDYQLQLSKVDGVWRVTNGVDGWGKNCRDEFKDAKVTPLYESLPPQPEKVVKLATEYADAHCNDEGFSVHQMLKQAYLASFEVYQSAQYKLAEEPEWNIGDKFTTPETGETIFTVASVSKNNVEASDARSRAGVSSFLKSYIKKHH